MEMPTFWGKAFLASPPSERIIAILLVPGSHGFGVLWSLGMTMAGS
jgi:hypothetical protein